MRVLKFLAALAVIAVPLSIVARASGPAPGECGEYMYWKHGKCLDARNAAPESWPDQMAKKKATW